LKDFDRARGRICVRSSMCAERCSSREQVMRVVGSGEAIKRSRFFYAKLDKKRKHVVLVQDSGSESEYELLGLHAR